MREQAKQTPGREHVLDPDEHILWQEGRPKPYPIRGDTVLEFENGAPATIYLANEIKRTNKRTRTKSIGFERIAEGTEINRLLRDIQRDAA